MYAIRSYYAGVILPVVNRLIMSKAITVNGSSYEAKDGSQSHTETEITYHEPWPDPVGMIKRIKENDMHLVLWQIPALKELDERQICIQHDKVV